MLLLENVLHLGGCPIVSDSYTEASRSQTHSQLFNAARGKATLKDWESA